MPIAACLFMRIAYVSETYPPEINGVSLTVARTLACLRERGHSTLLVRPRQPGESPCDDDEEWRCFGRPIPVYPDLRFGLAMPGSLRLRFMRARVELVHLATPGPLAWAALGAARALGLPTSSDFRTNFHHYSRHYGLGACEGVVLAGLKHFHNRTQCTFVPTREALKDLAQHRFENLCVVGRGVDVERFHPRHRSLALRREWRAAEDDVVLLLVSRLAAEKNVGLALRSFRSLQAQCPTARMVVVGDGPMRRRLEAAYPQVHFAGMLRGEALAQAYASADLFVFPSLSETFGNVTLEALASGLPVVAYRAAAAQEHVQHRRSGWLATPGDEADFLRGVELLARQPAAARALMRAHALEAAAAAQWDEVHARFERRLEEVLRGYRAPSGKPAVAV